MLSGTLQGGDGEGATEAQSKQIKTYLRKLIANYQGGNVCDTLTDAELNELLQLRRHFGGAARKLQIAEQRGS